MRAFLMCAVLAVAGLTLTTTSARADHWYHGYYRPPVVVVRPAPVVIAPAPVVVVPAPVVVAPYPPAPVIVAPVVRPLVSLRMVIR